LDHVPNTRLASVPWTARKLAADVVGHAARDQLVTRLTHVAEVEEQRARLGGEEAREIVEVRVR
jgi:hypothetical protein